MHVRSLVRLIGVTALAVSLTVPLAGPASAHQDRGGRLPDRIELPTGFLPEGIAIDHATAYFGSRADGDIYAASLITGRGRVISQGPGTPSVGVKIDDRDRLFVAGGNAGNGRVVGARSGKVLASYQFTSAPSFINDVVLTDSYAWFTDSLQAQLYGVRLDRHGSPASTFVTLPLRGAWTQTPGVNNANGIAATPDGRALLVIQSNTGLLFRVDPRTGEATQVDLGGSTLANGDGLLVRGRILYAVQNRLNQVAVVALDRAGTGGKLVKTLTSPDFDVPTTVAAFGHSLYLPNARFTSPQTPDTTFWATRIDAF